MCTPRKSLRGYLCFDFDYVDSRNEIVQSWNYSPLQTRVYSPGYVAEQEPGTSGQEPGTYAEPEEYVQLEQFTESCFLQILKKEICIIFYGFFFFKTIRSSFCSE